MHWSKPMRFNRSHYRRPVRLIALVIVAVAAAMTLTSCGDAANHRAFREVLTPLEGDLEVGMTEAELTELVNNRYPQVSIIDYSYSEEFGDGLFDPEAIGPSSWIVQLTTEGDPTNNGSTSVCFIKVLVDRSSDSPTVSDLGSGIDCPA